jgi:hypothetical protein
MLHAGRHRWVIHSERRSGSTTKFLLDGDRGFVKELAPSSAVRSSHKRESSSGRYQVTFIHRNHDLNVRSDGL